VSRYLAIGVVLFAVLLSIFFMMYSSSPIKDVENVKQLINKKEEKILANETSSVDIEIEYSNDNYKNSDKDESEIETIEKLTGESGLEPLFKEWKQKGDILFKVYIKPPKAKESNQKLAPPSFPSFTAVEIAGETINIVIPSGAKGYVVTKDGDEINYQPLESSMEAIAPIGY